MKKLSYIALVIALCASPMRPQRTSEPRLSKDQLSAERMTLYRDFLKSYREGSKGVLNVSMTTDAFQKPQSDIEPCLKVFKIVDLTSPSIHTFTADAFPSFNVHLVDPKKHKGRDPGDAIRNGESVDTAVEAGFAAGIFTFSEIIFDSSHTHAAFRYSFVCGGLCGHGGTLIYALAGSSWKLSKSRCGSWIS